MSNYNLESFRGYEGQIIAGPEVINGTGKVQLKFFEGSVPDGGESVFFTMDADEVLDLADWLARHAFDAKRRKWTEEHTLSG